MRAPNWIMFVFSIQLMLLNKKVTSLKPEKSHVTIKYSHDEVMTLNISESVDYTFVYKNNPKDNQSDSYLPSRILISSPEATRKYPLFISAIQEIGISSWQVPFIENDKNFSNFSRTLCPYNNFFDDADDNRPIINVYSYSEKNITFQLKISLVEDFFLPSIFARNIAVSPSTPQVYFYSFEKDNNTGNGSIAENLKYELHQIGNSDYIVIRFDSADDYCMVVSIQNATCPIYDTEHHIFLEGIHETMSRRGGITISRSDFPSGFFIVFVVKATDVDCTNSLNSTNGYVFQNNFENKNDGRMKNVKIQIIPDVTREQFWIAIIMPFVVFFILSVIFFSGVCIHKPSINYQVMLNNTTVNGNVANSTNNKSANNSNTNETIDPNKDTFLNQLYTKGPEYIKRQSRLYCWHIITISVFYGIPVVQLLITYQKSLNQSGNHDLCYYNFLCSHRVGYLSDFNHLFSNILYILLGLFFLLFTFLKQRQNAKIAPNHELGIPPHYGIFYAMGISLVMEGVLSASYHVCPNHTNFQFDTSFMYIMTVLGMVKIYQSRHPDINFRAHTTYIVLALSIIICLIGILWSNICFWIIFTILHIGACLYLTIDIYYMRRWKFNPRSFFENFEFKNLFRRNYYNKYKIVAIFVNLANASLAICGIFIMRNNFPTQLLSIFLLNLSLHLFFYVFMKWYKNEKLEIHTWVLLASTVITWIAALYFFSNASAYWELTPAESRTYNRECLLMHFYDRHDIWHMLSAIALFFSFTLLLILDDDIMHKPHSEILVY